MSMVVKKDEIIRGQEEELIALRADLAAKNQQLHELRVSQLAHVDQIRCLARSNERHKRSKRHIRKQNTELKIVLEHHQIDWKAALGIEDRDPRKNKDSN